MHVRFATSPVLPTGPGLSDCPAREGQPARSWLREPPGYVTAGRGAGLRLARQRVTLHLDGLVAHIPAGGVLIRALACPVPGHARPRPRGARDGAATAPQLPDSLTVLRRVSVRGIIMVGGQRIQVGLPDAGKTAEATIETDAFAVRVPPDVAVIAARTPSSEIGRQGVELRTAA